MNEIFYTLFFCTTALRPGVYFIWTSTSQFGLASFQVLGKPIRLGATDWDCLELWCGEHTGGHVR